MDKKITLVDFRAENLLFSINKGYEAGEAPVPFDVRMNSQFKVGENSGDPTFLNLLIRVFDDAQEKNYPFSLVADVTGVFIIEADTPEEREALLKEEGMNVLLPYARVMVSQLASLANMPTPVILPPLNVANFRTAEEQ